MIEKLILKSEDAKQKFCPWCYANPNDGYGLGIKCETEMCMAWVSLKFDNQGYCALINGRKE